VRQSKSYAEATRAATITTLAPQEPNPLAHDTSLPCMIGTHPRINTLMRTDRAGSRQPRSIKGIAVKKGKNAEQEINKLLRNAADEERRLLKRERRAEQELVDLQAELAKDEERLERADAGITRRRKEIAEAEARLRERQEARARGPEIGIPPAGATEANEADREPSAGASSKADSREPADESPRPRRKRTNRPSRATSKLAATADAKPAKTRTGTERARRSRGQVPTAAE